ncbi:MAG: hypothetical protein JW774_11695 [Candidatus Aureabacteria bacterium]|nr:hypothetical protein [Candidatus Auribacterota bacterium]
MKKTILIALTAAAVVLINTRMDQPLVGQAENNDFDYIDFQPEGTDVQHEFQSDRKGFLDEISIFGQNYMEISTGRFYSGKPTRLCEMRYVNGLIQMMPWADVALLDDAVYGKNPLEQKISPRKWRSSCRAKSGQVFAAEATALHGGGGGIAVFKVTSVTKDRITFIFTYYPNH